MATEQTWRKSSYSGNTTDSNCVEVSLAQNAVVRDSKNASGDVLAFSASAWQSMLSWLN